MPVTKSAEQKIEEARGRRSAVVLGDIPIAKAVRRGEGDTRQNLVFGWVNVPEPGAETVQKDIGTLIDGSLEQDLAEVRQAYRDQFEDREHEWSDVIATFLDEKRVIIGIYRQGGQTELFGISFKKTDDEGIQFVFPMQQLSVEVVEKDFPGVVARAEVIKSQGYPSDVTPKTDLQGDQVPMEELEQAMYNFVLKSGKADVDHKEVLHGMLVESFVVTEEKLIAMGFDEDVAKAAPKGAWSGFLVDDETFDRVESGELTMFSFGGSARRTPVD